MAGYQDMNSLADTLRRSGLAASASEAVRMAQSIMHTEKKVTTDFDTRRNQIDKGLEKKSYKAEIDDIIAKTDFSKKDFYVPVSGYRKPIATEVPVAQPTVVQPVAPAAPVVEPVAIEREHKSMMQNSEILTIDLDSDTSLKELMDADAERVYEDKPQQTTTSAENINESTKDIDFVYLDKEQAPREEEVKSIPAAPTDEFILDLEEEKPAPVAAPEPPKPEPVQRQELPRVDLMQHFNFGKR